MWVLNASILHEISLFDPPCYRLGVLLNNCNQNHSSIHLDGSQLAAAANCSYSVWLLGLITGYWLDPLVPAGCTGTRKNGISQSAVLATVMFWEDSYGSTCGGGGRTSAVSATDTVWEDSLNSTSGGGVRKNSFSQCLGYVVQLKQDIWRGILTVSMSVRAVILGRSEGN